MPAYLIISMDVSDPARMGRYREALKPILEAHGGKPIVQRAKVKVLEGHAPDLPLSIIEFSSHDALQRFWDSPEYQHVKAMREGAASIDAWAVDGIG